MDIERKVNFMPIPFDNNFYIEDGAPIKHVELMSSAAHTYGNAIAFIENWLINLFPENFFKTISSLSQ